MPDYVVLIIVSLFSSVLTAFLTRWLVVRGVGQQRNWEKIAAEYRLIMEALHDLQIFCLEHSNLQQDGLKISDMKLHDFESCYFLLVKEIEKRRDMASFLISQESLNLLQDLTAQLTDNVQAANFFEYISHSRDLISDAIASMESHARVELRT